MTREAGYPVFAGILLLLCICTMKRMTQRFLVNQTKLSCDGAGMEPLAFSFKIPYDLHRCYILWMYFTF